MLGAERCHIPCAAEVLHGEDTHSAAAVRLSVILLHNPSGRESCGTQDEVGHCGCAPRLAGEEDVAQQPHLCAPGGIP